jgi:NAD(P)-dependent dehydrogenase (short-subunit alcohol dehydrogenase family)
VPEGRTNDGFETHFGTNFLAHFYLFQQLKDILVATSTPDFPSRVVSVSSVGHRCGPIRFDDINFDNEAYDPWKAYGQSKTATIYLANEIERQFGAQGLHATSVHPGLIMTFKQEQGGWEDPNMRVHLKDPGQGAATTVYAAVSQEWKCRGGRYLADCREQGATQHPENPMFIGDDGYAAWAFDEAAAKKLWEMSLSLVEV